MLLGEMLLLRGRTAPVEGRFFGSSGGNWLDGKRLLVALQAVCVERIVVQKGRRTDKSIESVSGLMTVFADHNFAVRP